MSTLFYAFCFFGVTGTSNNIQKLLRKVDTWKNPELLTEACTWATPLFPVSASLTLCHLKGIEQWGTRFKESHFFSWKGIYIFMPVTYAVWAGRMPLKAVLYLPYKLAIFITKVKVTRFYLSSTFLDLAFYLLILLASSWLLLLASHCFLQLISIISR